MNRLLLCAGGLAVLLLLGGCSDGSDSTELVGTWQAAKLVVTDTSGTRTETPLPASWSETLVLNLDGTFAFASTQNGRTRTGGGFWGETADGLVFAGRRETTRAYRLDGKTLVMSGAIPEGTYALRWRKTAAAQ
jgi:uncharacterized lipoprotein NlpE involved in copper resistance